MPRETFVSSMFRARNGLQAVPPKTFTLPCHDIARSGRANEAPRMVRPPLCL